MKYLRTTAVKRIAALLCCGALMASCTSTPQTGTPESEQPPTSTAEALLQAHPEAADMLALIEEANSDQILGVAYVGGKHAFSRIYFIKDGEVKSLFRDENTPAPVRYLTRSTLPSSFAQPADALPLESFFVEAKNQQDLCGENATVSTMQVTSVKTALSNHTCASKDQPRTFIDQEQLPDLPNLMSPDGLDHMLSEARLTLGDHVTFILFEPEYHSFLIQGATATCEPSHQCTPSLSRPDIISKSEDRVVFSTDPGTRLGSHNTVEFSIADLSGETLWDTITHPRPEPPVVGEDFAKTITTVSIFSRTSGKTSLLIETENGQKYLGEFSDAVVTPIRA